MLGFKRLLDTCTRDDEGPSELVWRPVAERVVRGACRIWPSLVLFSPFAEAAHPLKSS